MEKKSHKLALLTANLKLSNSKGFDSYLKEVYINLISRITKNENDNNNKNIRQDLLGLTKLIFIKYYSLPGIIGDRLFRVFDSKKNGVLEYNEFKTGMIMLFCENYEKTLRFIFDFYDFDADGKISKEDIRIVLLYVTYSDDKDKENIENHKKIYENKINQLLSLCFMSQPELIDFTTFTNIVENINSDIYFMIYIFLLKKKPFSYKCLELYNTDDLNKNLNNNYLPINNSEKVLFYDYFNKNYPHNFGSLSNINLRNVFNFNNKLLSYKSDSNINSTYFNSQLLIPRKISSLLNREFKQNLNLNKEDIENYNRRKNFQQTELFKNLELNSFEINLESTMFEAILPYDLYLEMDKVTYNEEDFEKEEVVEKEELESENNNYEGYIYKIKNGKMIKIWFKLLYKDLFYFKNKEDLNHKGMHNLSGLFLKEEATKILYDKEYYCFSIIFPFKKRVYYCDNKAEFKNWKKYLRKAINYSNILEMYKITKELGKGSFSTVRLGINRITNQKVAVKIMDKKKMNSLRLESARTEIEIMKICQFPYIIKFIDAYENIDYIYIFMEYCPGGTLYTFIKKRNFSIDEKLAANILYKVFLAVYYFHSYGIAHRDLKPENVLMTSEKDDADIRILDFGLGKIIGPNEKCSEPYGTLVYCAPEIIQNKPYTKIVDSWSLGIITYILLFGKIPFYHEEKPLLKHMIVERQPTYKGKGLPHVSEESINFVQNLLNKDPNKRMSVSQALQHKWFKKFTQNNIIKLKDVEANKKDMPEIYYFLK